MPGTMDASGTSRNCMERITRFSPILTPFWLVLLWVAQAQADHTFFSRSTHDNNFIATRSSDAGAAASTGSAGAVFNIRTLGAKGDGSSNDTPAFLKAWSMACSSGAGAATVLVPTGGSFVLSSNTNFVGRSCASKIIFQVDGLVVGPGDKSKWINTQAASASWMQFTDCKDFTLKGKGTFDARGNSFWPSRKGGPMAIRFLRGTNVAVVGITIKNAPQIHLKFNVCNGVLVQGITIDSPGDSPNTNGIHMQTNVYNVQILDCIIKSGDDCISIGTGTHNVIVRNVICGPGHGVSVGSLGNNGLLACVSDIDVSFVTFINTLCGCRIKTCAGGSGKAARISFRNIKMENVKTPIMVDQYYCGKTVKPQNVLLENIEFVNVKGSAAPSKYSPVHLDCAQQGCNNIRLQNIQLQSPGNKPALCSNSYGTYGGVMQPSGCLRYKVGANSRSVAGCMA